MRARAPGKIVYIPEGPSEITPLVNGKAAREPVKVTVDPGRGAEIAARLQADLEARQRENVRPWVDFEHRNGRSSWVGSVPGIKQSIGLRGLAFWSGVGGDDAVN